MEVNQRCKPGNNRTPRSRALGNALREARLDRDIGLRQFAKEIGRDSSLLSRWETGDRTPTPTDVAHILGKLGVTGERYDEIIDLAYGTDDARWLATTVPEQRAQLAALLDFEETASAIVDVSPLVIPGLLQTSNYARAIMTDGGVPADEISTRVTIRLGRGFLVEMSARPNVDVRVVPFDSGFHPGLEGPFLLIESETQPSVVNVELRDSSLFLHTRPDVARYRRAADTVGERAVNSEDSLALIALAKAGWESA